MAEQWISAARRRESYVKCCLLVETMRHRGIKTQFATAPGLSCMLACAGQAKGPPTGMVNGRSPHRKLGRKVQFLIVRSVDPQVAVTRTLTLICRLREQAAAQVGPKGMIGQVPEDCAEGCQRTRFFRRCLHGHHEAAVTCARGAGWTNPYAAGCVIRTHAFRRCGNRASSNSDASCAVSGSDSGVLVAGR